MEMRPNSGKDTQSRSASLPPEEQPGDQLEDWQRRFESLVSLDDARITVLYDRIRSLGLQFNHACE